MSVAYQRATLSEIRHNLSLLSRRWGWFVLLGLVLIVLGGLALGAMFVATLATALTMAILLIAAGIIEIVGAFWARGWSGFFLHLLFGVLAVVVGVLFLRAPLDAILTLTLLMACLLIAGGLTTIVVAAVFRFSAWGLAVVSGIIEGVLGFLILWGWPETALWVLGLFLGITLIFRGVNWITLGFMLRNYRKHNAAGDARA